MDIRDSRSLKRHAAQALSSASYPPDKLVLIHSGVSAGLTLLLTVADLVLTRQIANTGGLSGMGARSILGTVQSVLGLLITVVATFWEFGILYAALRLTRREPAEPGTLAEGFRRFGPLLRLQLLRGVILFGLGLASFYIGILIFSMTPFMTPVMDILAPLLENASILESGIALDEATITTLIPAMMPAFVMIGVVFCVFSIPLLYRYRMAEYAVLDNDNVGAFASIRLSSQLMRGNRWALFRLDLSFWWFYLLQGLVILSSFGNTLLAAFGVTLPFDADVAMLICNVVCILLQLALYYRFRAQIETTYAAAYDALQIPRTPQVSTPPKQNWTY